MIPNIIDAVKALYSNAATVFVESPTEIQAYDSNNQPILINIDNVNAELVILQNSYELQQLKNQAKELLSETDYTEIPSVNNPANTPYLKNANEFIAYRNVVRAIAVNPTIGSTFPTAPTAQWSS